MDAKGTEDKKYSYQYLERLKYGLNFFKIKTVSEHNFILERCCPNLPSFQNLFLCIIFFLSKSPSYHTHTCAFPLPLPPQYVEIHLGLK